MADRTIEKYSTKRFPGRRDDSILGQGERVTETHLKSRDQGIELDSEKRGGDIFDVIGPKLKGYCELKSVSDGTAREGFPDERRDGEFGNINLEVVQSYTQSGYASIATAKVRYDSTASESDLNVVRRALTSSMLEKI